jgi:hypothetical protein
MSIEVAAPKVDPIGLDLPEDREVWLPELPYETSDRYEIDPVPGLKGKWIIVFAAEQDAVLAGFLLCVPAATAKAVKWDLKAALSEARADEYFGVLILTYADGKWIVLAEYRV